MRADPTLGPRIRPRRTERQAVDLASGDEVEDDQGENADHGDEDSGSIRMTNAATAPMTLTRRSQSGFAAQSRPSSPA
jgi:hypothetical protein